MCGVGVHSVVPALRAFSAFLAAAFFCLSVCRCAATRMSSEHTPGTHNSARRRRTSGFVGSGATFAGRLAASAAAFAASFASAAAALAACLARKCAEPRPSSDMTRPSTAAVRKSSIGERAAEMGAVAGAPAPVLAASSAVRASAREPSSVKYSCTPHARTHTAPCQATGGICQCQGTPTHLDVSDVHAQGGT